MLENEKLNKKGEYINKKITPNTHFWRTEWQFRGTDSYLVSFMPQQHPTITHAIEIIPNSAFRYTDEVITDEVIKSELNVFAWQTEIESKRIRMLNVQFEMLICFRSVRSCLHDAWEFV